jgi:hypothetical protein
MRVEFPTSVIKACSDFVIKLDQYLAGAVALVTPVVVVYQRSSSGDWPSRSSQWRQ